MSLLWFLLFGFLVGWIARAIVPGAQGMGAVRTTLLGAVGSFVGGLLGNVISGSPLDHVHSAGWIGSVLGAVILLAVLARR